MRMLRSVKVYLLGMFYGLKAGVSSGTGYNTIYKKTVILNASCQASRGETLTSNKKTIWGCFFFF